MDKGGVKHGKSGPNGRLRGDEPRLPTATAHSVPRGAPPATCQMACSRLFFAHTDSPSMAAAIYGLHQVQQDKRPVPRALVPPALGKPCLSLFFLPALS